MGLLGIVRMGAVEIEQAASKLAERPCDSEAVAFEFFRAYTSWRAAS